MKKGAAIIISLLICTGTITGCSSYNKIRADFNIYKENKTKNVSIDESSKKEINTIVKNEENKVIDNNQDDNKLSAEEFDKYKEQELKSNNYDEINEGIEKLFEIERNLKGVSEEYAMEIVSQNTAYELSQMTVGVMNNNVYLVNTFTSPEKEELDNLYLVVNGKIVDQKYVSTNIESDTFVENFMKYQNVDPIIEQIKEEITNQQTNDYELAMRYAALLVKKQYELNAIEYSARKLNDKAFLIKYYGLNNRQGLINEYIIIDGNIDDLRFIDGNKESNSFEKKLTALAGK